jgi:hypothetical protein
MSVRKRQWKTRSGEQREAWVVDYFDADGDRHIETFERKKDADASPCGSEQSTNGQGSRMGLDQARRDPRPGAHHGQAI